MILTKTVKLKPHANWEYYKSLGYKFEKPSDIIDIKVEDLTKGSKSKILVRCDICNTEKETTYKTYNYSIENGNYYACSSKCANKKKELNNLEKYGVKNVSEIREIRKKAEKTMLEKYGEKHYAQTEEGKEKTKKTLKEKYGVEYLTQNDEIKEKIKETNLKKYGNEFYLQSDIGKEKTNKTLKEKYGDKHFSQTYEVKNKTKETNLKKYGCNYGLQNDTIKEKGINTNLKKYGKKYYSQTEEYIKKVKNTKKERYGDENYINTEKCKKTCLERYGVTNVMYKEKFREKIKQTNLKKYGVEYSLQSKEILERIKQTNLKKYGVDNIFKSPIFKIENIERNKNKLIKSYSIENYQLLNINDIFGKNLEFKHEKCGNIFKIYKQYFNIRKTRNEDICTICNPIFKQYSSYETNIQKYLDIYNIDYKTNDRTVLDRKELDIYIPSKKLAIEFNGLYWHSELHKPNDYHKEKTELCKEKGIHLLHIFEDDWLFKQDIVKSIINNKLGIVENKIYARQTEIKEVKSDKARLFLDNNHIQGFSKSSYKLGLYYNNELVSLMTFGYRYTNAKKEFELIRFCNKINYTIVGAASKLFKHFIKNYSNQLEEKYIISYADISLFDGSLYDTLGFSFKHRTKPNYFWVVDGIREHRFKYNKQNLIKEGANPLLTEREIMYEKGYYRIFGSGQDRYEYEI